MDNLMSIAVPHFLDMGRQRSRWVMGELHSGHDNINQSANQGQPLKLPFFMGKRRWARKTGPACLRRDKAAAGGSIKCQVALLRTLGLPSARCRN